MKYLLIALLSVNLFAGNMTCDKLDNKIRLKSQELSIASDRSKKNETIKLSDQTSQLVLVYKDVCCKDKKCYDEAKVALKDLEDIKYIAGKVF